MICPACPSRTFRVVNSRARDGFIWRRRECKRCGTRFSTVEQLATVERLGFDAPRAKAGQARGVRWTTTGPAAPEARCEE